MKKKRYLFFVTSLMLVFASSLSSTERNAIYVNTISDQMTEFAFTLPSYNIETIVRDGFNFDYIKIDEGVTTPLTGLPELPIFSASIAVPVNSKVTIDNIYLSETYKLENITIFPCQNYDNEFYTFDIDNNFYYAKDNNLVFPDVLYSISDIETMRDYQFITISIHPMRFYSALKQLEVTEEIYFVINHPTIDQNPSYNLRPKMSRYFEPIYESLLVNYNQIRLHNPIYQEPSLLIIHGQAIGSQANAIAELNKFVTWKKQRGMKVELAVVSTTQIGNSQPAGTSTSTIKTFLQNKYNQGDVEFVLFMGTPGSPSTTNYNVPSFGASGGGNSDTQYSTMTSGNYGDIFVGRFVATTLNDLSTYVNKVIRYERDIISEPTTNSAWLGRSLLVGESRNSGVSTYLVNRYIKSIIQEYHPTHVFQELYATNPSGNTIATALNAGQLNLSFRGYLAASPIEAAMGGLTNNNLLFNSVIITCSTGGMGGCLITSITKMAAGSGALIGAISAVGMANSGTATAMNNVLQGGIYYGLYPANMATMGQSTTFARNNLLSNYSSSAWNATAVSFTTMMNYVGDPSYNAYKALPKTFTNQFPTSIPKGTQSLRFEILDNDGFLVPNTWVTLTQFTGNLSSNPVITYLTKSVSDETGVVYLSLDPSITGDLRLTVSREDFITKTQTIATNVGEMVAVNSFVINDILGNNNGIINPGEVIHLTINVQNYKNNTLSNLTAILSSEDQLVNITSDTVSLGTLGPEAINNYYDAFTFEVSPLYQDAKMLPLRIEITDGIESWFSYITSEVKGVNLNFVSMAPSFVNINNFTSIHFSLKNNGSINGTNLYAQLIPRSSFLLANDTIVSIGNIMQGQTVNNVGPFIVNVSDAIWPGIRLSADLYVYNNAGFEEFIPIKVFVGNVTQTDPTGPDEYGYLMLGSNDTNYYNPEDIDEAITPAYRWRSIRTIGTNTNMVDASAAGQEARLNVNLPFTANYYGNEFDNVTICSNGWLVFGPTDQTDFRNVYIPGPIVPRNILAPYWTDLVVGGSYGGGIYYYYDQLNDAFIVQWDRLKWVTSYSGENTFSVSTDSVTFQAIIYDPMVHGTSLGDSPIKFQYHRWNPGIQTGGGRPFNYVTVGFQDGTALRGLTYVYDNVYTPGSAPITNNFAILITQPHYMNDGSYLMINEIVLHDQNGNGIIEAGEIVNIGVSLKNLGIITANEVQATINFPPDVIEVINSNSIFPDIEYLESQSNINYFTIRVHEDTPNNTEIRGTIKYSIQNIYSPNYREWTSNITFIAKKPTMVYRSLLINDYQGNNNGILEPGENVKIIVTISNNTNLEILDVHATIQETSPYAIINQNTDYVPIMNPFSNYQFVFEITTNDDLSGLSSIPLSLNVRSANANPITQSINLGVNQSGTLLQHFGDNLLAPWQIQGYYNNWSISETNYAGGTAPEILFQGPVNSGTTRYISGVMDTREVSSVLLSFKNAANVALPGVVSLKVHSRPASNSPWTEVWSVDLVDSYEATEVSILINNNLGTETFQICFTVEGFLQGVESWYIDDIVVETAFGNTSIVKGRLNIMNHYNRDITHIAVRAGDYNTNIKQDGTYTLYLIPKIYPNLIVSDPNFEGNSYNNFVVLAGQILENRDFYVHYKTPPHNLRRFSDGNGDLELRWDFIYDMELDILGFQGFQILKQVNSLAFTQIVDPQFVEYDTQNNLHRYSFNEPELLTIRNIYRYTVRAVYASSLSDTTNHVYVDPTEIYDDQDVNIIDDIVELDTFKLFPNYPNPFNPSTNIKFSIPKSSRVEVKIFNIKGQLVKTLLDDFLSKGEYTIQWHGDNNHSRGVSSGIYFIRIQNENNIAIRKSILLK